MDSEKVRIDKWLHGVRLCKTRTIATSACENSKVLINGNPVKPARLVSIGDEIELKDGPIRKKYKVLALTEKRMAAKLVEGFVLDITSEEDLAKLAVYRQSMNTYRPNGSGRPTKKERRQLDSFTFFSDWIDD